MRAILTYHSIDDSGSPISVTEGAFERHLESLRTSGVRVVTVEQLLASEADGDAVAITFDDGFTNFGTKAWPRLEAYGLPVTLFVPTAHAGGRASWNHQAGSRCPVLPLLDWNALGGLADAGVRIESHGRTHRDLRLLSDGELEDEVGGAADEMARQLGRRPKGYAYPFGAHDARVRAAVARSADWGCTTEFHTMPASDPYQLPRLDAYYYRSTGFSAWGRLTFRARARLIRGGRALRSLAERGGTVR